MRTLLLARSITVKRLSGSYLTQQKVPAYFVEIAHSGQEDAVRKLQHVVFGPLNHCRVLRSIVDIEFRKGF